MVKYVHVTESRAGLRFCGHGILRLAELTKLSQCVQDSQFDDQLTCQMVPF